MGRFFLGFILGAGLVFSAQRYHLVRTDDGFFVIPKISSTFEEAYVDIRQFGLDDWNQHKALAAAMIKAKKDHLLKDSAADSFRKGIKDAVDNLTSGS